ncbi:MAG TPA: PAS domain-containing protein [Thermoanaerobaculia bacterium]|nr:PAS domain-containing protein [Thermoanaerobaculia bacterium]
MIPFDTASQRYFSLLEELRQAVIVTDTEGQVLRWSTTAEGLYGWSVAEAVGQNVLRLTPTDQTREEAAGIMSALSEGKVWSGTFGVRTRDGRPFPACVTDVPVLDDRQMVIGIVGASSVSDAPVPVATTLLRFAKACDTVWPQRVRLEVEHAPEGMLTVSEPYVLHLLSLLTVRYAEALEGKTVLDVYVGKADESAFEEFNVDRMPDSVYIRIRERHAQPRFSLLRDEVRAARPSNFAGSLVRTIGGALLVESSAGSQIIHLLLPVQPRSQLVE